MNEAKGDPALAELYDVVVRLLEAKSPRPPRLVHEKRIRNWLTRAYYSVLNDDAKFRSDLANLLERWTGTGAESFAKRWFLPERGLADLASTLSLSRRGALTVPRLQVGSRSYPGLEEDADEDQGQCRREMAGLGSGRPLRPRGGVLPSGRQGCGNAGIPARRHRTSI